MADKKQDLNWLFASMLLVLAAVAGVSMYMNMGSPVIREAPASDPSASAQLPEGHPPIDSASKLTSLEQMSRSDPQNADVKIQIANAYYDMGQYQKAIGAYDEALKLRPGDPGAMTDLATCYHYLGQPDKALALLDEVLKGHPGFAQAMFNKGIVLQAGKNDVKGAVAIWQSLLQSNPDFPQKAELEKKINQLKSAAP